MLMWTSYSPGHVFAEACEILWIAPSSCIDSFIYTNQPATEQFIKNIASEIVKECTLINTYTEIEE